MQGISATKNCEDYHESRLGGDGNAHEKILQFSDYHRVNWD